ncbi:hypothetical protein [Arabiibacter massiliensis]|uniref:hypothetical protein n=1 Tax=Arabiibacter massiliensis TaxID=1870985 RepID=UPI0009BA886B|nr:hypothetical protein [Arabiibacter massiliensis]
MIERREFLACHWEPYLLCEREFLTLLDYVALRRSNFGTCSEKIIRQLLMTCELFESIAKAMYVYPEEPRFPNYASSLISDSLFDSEAVIEVVRGAEAIELKPFSGMTPSSAPKWWSDHNKVKHDRAANFEFGCFENALKALAGLYYVNLLFAKRIGDYWHGQLADHSDPNCRDVPNDISKLFETGSITTRHDVCGFESYAMTVEDVDAMFQ